MKLKSLKILALNSQRTKLYENVYYLQLFFNISGTMDFKIVSINKDLHVEFYNYYSSLFYFFTVMICTYLMFVYAILLG